MAKLVVKNKTLGDVPFTLVLPDGKTPKYTAEHENGNETRLNIPIDVDLRLVSIKYDDPAVALIVANKRTSESRVHSRFPCFGGHFNKKIVKTVRKGLKQVSLDSNTTYVTFIPNK